MPRHSGQIPVYHHQKAGSGHTADHVAGRGRYCSEMVVDRPTVRWALVCVDLDTHHYPTPQVKPDTGSSEPESS